MGSRCFAVSPANTKAPTQHRATVRVCGQQMQHPVENDNVEATPRREPQMSATTPLTRGDSAAASFPSVRFAGPREVVTVTQNALSWVNLVTFDQRFSINGDGNLVSHDDPAFVHGALPTHAEVVAIDGRGRDKTRTEQGSLINAFFPERCRPLTEVVDIKRDLTRHPAEREFSEHPLV